MRGKKDSTKCMTPNRAAHDNSCSMASSNHIDVASHNQDAISIRSEDEDGEVDGDFVGPSPVTPYLYIFC